MSEKYYVEPSSSLTFDWVYRQFERIQLLWSLLSDGFVYKYATHNQSTDGNTLNIGEKDEYLLYLVNPGGATVTVNLPSIESLSGRMLYVKNTATSSTPKYVNVQPAGSDKIDRRQTSSPPNGNALPIDRLISLQLIADSETATWWVI